MKKLIFIIGLFLYVYQVNGQKLIEKHIDFSQKTKLVLDLQIADSIRISTWKKNEVFAKASINVNDNKDNNAYLASFDDSGNEIRISADFDKALLSKKNNCINTEIYWEIFIPENAVFSVKTISGNIIIEGNISEIKANSISGFVDITIPSNIKADLNCKTISGTIYSNHEFAFNDSKNSHSSRINTKINGGGKKIDLETISGDIFFREIKK